jgi:hypothetical protein
MSSRASDKGHRRMNDSRRCSAKRIIMIFRAITGIRVGRHLSDYLRKKPIPRRKELAHEPALLFQAQEILGGE